MIVKLGDINAYLERIGLLLVVDAWDGKGERDPVRDATKLELITLRAWRERINEAG